MSLQILSRLVGPVSLGAAVLIVVSQALNLGLGLALGAQSANSPLHTLKYVVALLAMYALLLENEALEAALMAQNEKLKDERQDALKEQMRSTSYRRVLMSQLMNDERIKSYVAEIMADDKRLPGPEHATVGTAPANGRVVHEGEETSQS